MRTFKDNRGRTWEITVDDDARRRVRDETGVELLQIGTGRKSLAKRPAELVEVLWTLIRPQAEAQGVEPDDFGRSLVIDPFNAAVEAMIQAIFDGMPEGDAERHRAEYARQKATN